MVGEHAQDYTYDANGNLFKDANKQSTLIHYNHLDLVDTLTYADGRKMIYNYTAAGEKAIAATGTVLKKRDYTGGYLYANDSLREIQHEDGRAVPM